MWAENCLPCLALRAVISQYFGIQLEVATEQRTSGTAAAQLVQYLHQRPV